MLADQFTQVFRHEHRQVRDALLDLIQAFQTRDKQRVSSLLGHIAALTGPHFRYEEEALYPGLVDIFGQEYVQKLLGDHDFAIGAAKKLVEIAGKGSLAEADATKAMALVRRILPHVSDCDGLSIMVERLAEDKVQTILAARDKALAADLDLLQWSSRVRGRPAAVVP